MRMARSSSLTVPNDLSCLPAIQAYASEMAKSVGFPPGEAARIVLALEEAVVNVVEHAFDPSEEASYQIVFVPLSTGLKIVIKEKGLPFLPDEIPPYAPPSDIDHMPEKGLGSFLMKKSVDEVIFRNAGREGNELQLVKYLPFKSIVDLQDASELERYPEPKKDDVPREVKAFTIRPMKEDECLQVSRLFYRAYGYSYLHDAIYYPDKFAQLHRDGLIVSIVTEAEGSGIVGHVALTRESADEKIAEAGMAAVRPDFRGHGFQNGMIKALINEGRRIGLSGIFSEAVTNHEYAQKAGLRAGFKRCGLAVGMLPTELSFKGIHAELSQRESLAYGFVPLADPDVIVVYPPAHHRAFIESVFANLGLGRTFGPVEGAGVPEETSSLKTSIVPAMGFAAIEVYKYGRDVVSEIGNLLKELKVKKLEEVRLFLNLQDPLTATRCADFEKLGFFIAGVLPFSSVGDALILQYLNNVAIDYDRICAVGEAAQQILAYVRGHDPNGR